MSCDYNNTTFSKTIHYPVRSQWHIFKYIIKSFINKCLYFFWGKTKLVSPWRYTKRIWQKHSSPSLDPIETMGAQELRAGYAPATLLSSTNWLEPNSFCIEKNLYAFNVGLWNKFICNANQITVFYLWWLLCHCLTVWSMAQVIRCDRFKT